MLNKICTMTAKSAPYPPCTVTALWLKNKGRGRCFRRVTQPPHIAGPLVANLTASYHDNILKWHHYLKENALDSISKSIITDLADKFSSPDYRDWTSSDFPNKILIDNRDTILTYKKELTRLGYTDKNAKKELRSQINTFNNYEIKHVYRISRPIFHVSGEYAVIQYDNCVNLFGGGVVLLFRKVNGKWVDYISI